ncbi:MAG: VTT domain-containing protein [Candidatus Methylacidiphilales bacterium]|nr:VTT domain-containing protein [Candidatus Methylacidiphilales bacterium]
MIETFSHWLHSLYSTDGITQIILSGGVLVLVAIVFAETGLLAGFFLPGDSLLVTAGVIAASPAAQGQPLFNIWVLSLAVSAAAVIGDQVGFLLGRKTGQAIFQRADGRFFKRRYIQEAHDFYVRHGGKAVVAARFMPIMRTFVPFAAGVADMPYRRFVGFNVMGGVFWVFSMLWLGYFLGQTPLAKKLHHIILVVVVISVLPIVIGVARRWWASRSETNG